MVVWPNYSGNHNFSHQMQSSPYHRNCWCLSTDEKWNLGVFLTMNWSRRSIVFVKDRFLSFIHQCCFSSAMLEGELQMKNVFVYNEKVFVSTAKWFVEIGEYFYIHQCSLSAAKWLASGNASSCKCQLDATLRKVEKKTGTQFPRKAKIWEIIS